MKSNMWQHNHDFHRVNVKIVKHKIIIITIIVGKKNILRALEFN